MVKKKETVVKRKPKMKDFGALGKWSIATLKQQKERKTNRYGMYHTDDYMVPSIEALYKQKREDITERTEQFEIRYNFKKTSISELHNLLANYKTLKEEKGKLYKDYYKYASVMYSI